MAERYADTMKLGTTTEGTPRSLDGRTHGVRTVKGVSRLPLQEQKGFQGRVEAAFDKVKGPEREKLAEWVARNHDFVLGNEQLHAGDATEDEAE